MYWKSGGAPFDYAGMTLEEWRKRDQDVHSTVADPGFVAPDRGDFRLKPDGAAARLGFQTIDVGAIGRETRRGSKPTRFAPAFPLPAKSGPGGQG